MSQRPSSGLIAAVAAITACGTGPATSGSSVSSGSNAATSSNAAVEALAEADIDTLNVRIETYGQGACAMAYVVAGGEEVRVVDTCHGWVMAGCYGLTLFHTKGVRVDSARILIPRRGAAGRENLLVAETLVADAVSERFGPRFEYLHLSFLAAQCTRSGLEVPFSGSYIRRGASGPASGMAGVVVVDDADGTSSVRIGPD